MSDLIAIEYPECDGKAGSRRLAEGVQKGVGCALARGRGGAAVAGRVAEEKKLGDDVIGSARGSEAVPVKGAVCAAGSGEGRHPSPIPYGPSMVAA
jgi:hypothetical protein